MLQLVAMLLMAVARRLPHARATALRLAIANIHRPGALTPTIVLSLGLGLALLVTVIEIDGNLRRQFEGALAGQGAVLLFHRHPVCRLRRASMPSSATHAPQADLERVPMLRGRIVAANGIKADDLKAVAERRLGAAKRPRHHLRNRSPRAARLWSRGTWWSRTSRGRHRSRSRKRSPTGSV